MLTYKKSNGFALIGQPQAVTYQKKRLFYLFLYICKVKKTQILRDGKKKKYWFVFW